MEFPTPFCCIYAFRTAAKLASADIVSVRDRLSTGYILPSADDNATAMILFILCLRITRLHYITRERAFSILLLPAVSRNTAPAGPSSPAPNIGLSGTKKGRIDASTSSIVSNGASKSW